MFRKHLMLQDTQIYHINGTDKARVSSQKTSEQNMLWMRLLLWFVTDEVKAGSICHCILSSALVRHFTHCQVLMHAPTCLKYCFPKCVACFLMDEEIFMCLVFYSIGSAFPMVKSILHLWMLQGKNPVLLHRY